MSSFFTATCKLGLIAGIIIFNGTLARASGHDSEQLVSCKTLKILTQISPLPPALGHEGDCADAIYHDSPYANQSILAIDYFGQDASEGRHHYRLTTDFWGGTGSDYVVFDRSCRYVCSETIWSE